MSGEKERVDGYISTIERFEPDIHLTDASAYGTSIAVSLKRITDAMTENTSIPSQREINEAV